MINRTITLVCLCLSAVVPSAEAQITHRAQLGSIIDLAPQADADLVVLGGVQKNRSYCIEIFTYNNSAALSTFSNIVGSNDTNLIIALTVRGNAYPRVYGGIPFTNAENARLCFITSGTSTAPSSELTFDLKTTGAAVSGRSTLKAVETTLSGGFNTSVTDFNFLELTNTTSFNVSDDGVISGTVVGRNAITDQQILSIPFSVNPGDRVDIDIHTAAGPGAFGPITVVHNGTPGALKGVVSQYRIISTNPFDFEPVVQQPLLTSAGTP